MDEQDPALRPTAHNTEAEVSGINASITALTLNCRTPLLHTNMILMAPTSGWVLGVLNCQDTPLTITTELVWLNNKATTPSVLFAGSSSQRHYSSTRRYSISLSHNQQLQCFGFFFQTNERGCLPCPSAFAFQPGKPTCSSFRLSYRLIHVKLVIVTHTARCQRRTGTNGSCPNRYVHYKSCVFGMLGLAL